jgi:hypothetical protein
MKAKTLALGLAALVCIGVSTSAATVFKISVEGQADVLTATPPVERGSVILVRRLSDGQLTAIPAELVRSMSSVPKTPIVKMTNLTTAASRSTLVLSRATTTLATSKSTPTLANGATTVFLGPTGGREATALGGVSGDTLIVSAARQAGMTATANSPGTSVEAQVFRSDLPRITPRANDLTVGNSLSLGTNAASSGAAPAPISIGPNGFPVFADVTIPALATIGPNGFITTAPATAVTTTASPIPIGSNGFPDPNAAPTTQTGLTVGGAATVPVTQPSTASRAAAGALSTAPTAASSMSAPAPSTGAAASSPK